MTNRIAIPASQRLTALLATGFFLAAGLQFSGCFFNNNPEPVTEETDGEEMVNPQVAVNEMVAENSKFNLNDATAEDFKTIPGVGDRMVREFREYRPYTSILQFRKEMGKYVDEAQVAEYEKYVYVPIDPNNSDDATVMQFPGVDESVIEELNLVKPFQSMDAFIETVSQYVTQEQLQQGMGLLAEE